MPPKTTFADFERVIHSPPMMADPLFEMMMADTVAEELDAKWSDSDSEEAVLAAEYAVGRVFSDYDPGPCTPRQSRGRRPPLIPVSSGTCADRWSAYPGEPGKMTVWKAGLRGLRPRH